MGSGASSNIATPPPWAMYHLPRDDRCILYPVPGTGEILDFYHKVYVKPEKINAEIGNYYGNYDSQALKNILDDKEKKIEKVDLMIDINSREGLEFMLHVFPKLDLDPARTLIVLIVGSDNDWDHKTNFYGHANEAFKLWAIIASVQKYSKCFVDRVFFNRLDVDQQLNAIGDIVKNTKEHNFYPDGEETIKGIRFFNERSYDRLFQNQYYTQSLEYLDVSKNDLQNGYEIVKELVKEGLKWDFDFERPKKPNCFERCGCKCCKAPKCCTCPKVKCPCSAPKCCKPPKIDVDLPNVDLPDLPKIDLPKLPEFKLPKKNRTRRKQKTNKMWHVPNSYKTSKKCILVGGRAAQTMLTSDCQTQLRPYTDEFEAVKNEEYVFVIDCTTQDLPESFVQQKWYKQEAKCVYFAVILLPNEKTERCQQALSTVFEICDNIIFINEGVDEGVNIIDGLLTCQNSLLDITEQINVFPRMKVIIPFYNDQSVALVTSMHQYDCTFSVVNLGSQYSLWHAYRAIDYRNCQMRMECDDVDIQLCQHLDGTIKILDMMTQDTVDGQGYKTAYDLKRDYEDFKKAVIEAAKK